MAERRIDRRKRPVDRRLKVFSQPSGVLPHRGSIRRQVDRRKAPEGSARADAQRLQRLVKKVNEYIQRRRLKAEEQGIDPKELVGLEEVTMRMGERIHNWHLVNLLDKAERDRQTGLLRKEEFKMFSDEYLKRNQEATLFVIDLNSLKRINDRFGHSIGDKFITSMAGAIILLADEYEFSAGRIGGDEFGLLLATEKLGLIKQFSSDLKEAFRRIWNEKKGKIKLNENTITRKE